nr:FCD domain-containing protein [Paracoccus denitrificans]
MISDRQAPELAYGNYSARELIEARPFIEIPAAGWAALRRSEEDMARLLQLCDSMERQEDALKWVRLDSDFHCLIAEAARNRLFARIVTDSRDSLMRQSELVNLMADRRVTSNHEHRRIAEAIAAGSETEARTAMRDHLHEVEQAMTWIISQRPANS